MIEMIDSLEKKYTADYRVSGDCVILSEVRYHGRKVPLNRLRRNIFELLDAAANEDWYEHRQHERGF